MGETAVGSVEPIWQRLRPPMMMLVDVVRTVYCRLLLVALVSHECSFPRNRVVSNKKTTSVPCGEFVGNAGHGHLSQSIITISALHTKNQPFGTP